MRHRRQLERPTLTLHIDHIDGQFWDCRQENLRFLCPNCHGQTATYAGRNRRRSAGPLVRVDAHGTIVDMSSSVGALSEQEKREVLASVDRRQMTVSDAARLIGCNRSHVYQLQNRLKEFGSLAPRPRRPRIPQADRDAAVAFALRHPSMGERGIASALTRQDGSRIAISPPTIRKILADAGLNCVADRRSAAARLENSATV